MENENKPPEPQVWTDPGIVGMSLIGKQYNGRQLLEAYDIMMRNQGEPGYVMRSRYIEAAKLLITVALGDHPITEAITNAIDVAARDGRMGKVSDGYHTFDELYYHRGVLFAVICNLYPELSWKSKQHHDHKNNPMYDGMFIVGIDTPEGPATYHYDLDPFWNIFNIKEIEEAPEWDGHTPGEAIRRIRTFITEED